MKRRGVKLREAFLAYPPARPHGTFTNPGRLPIFRYFYLEYYLLYTLFCFERFFIVQVSAFFFKKNYLSLCSISLRNQFIFQCFYFVSRFGHMDFLECCTYPGSYYVLGIAE